MIVASPEIVSAVASMTAIMGLANGTIGQRLVQTLVDNGRILELGPKILRPFYLERNRNAQGWLHEFLTAQGVDYGLHASEGAFFHWLWFRRLRVTSRELYERLKKRKVLVVPGEYFFFGLTDDWSHRHECIRVKFSGPPDVVREGLRRIAEEAAACQAE